jgi:CHASE2 domain-containing sensor protein
MELSGDQIRQLREALQSAFPDRPKLKQLVLEELDRNLDEIVGSGNLTDIIAELIDFAVAEGRIVELVTAANRRNPGNPELRLFMESYGLSPVEDDNPNITFDIVPPSRLRQLTRKNLLVISISASLIIGLLRFLGIFQGLELKTYDRLMSLRLLDEGRDDRLLIIQITDDDLKAQIDRGEEGKGSLKEATLNRLLEKLEKASPRLIGLDVYRDFKAPLVSRLKGLKGAGDRVIPVVGVCKVPDTNKEGKIEAGGTPPPSEIASDKVGFVDFTSDGDRVIRRYVMTMDTLSNSNCSAEQSFSLVLARMYLELEKNSDRYQYKNPFQSGEHLKFGERSFPGIQSFTGGYQDVNVGGYQVLLNYRARGAISADEELCNREQIAKCVTAEDILNNLVKEEKIRDKIVLIGFTAYREGPEDYHQTPYGRMPGVLIHANMVSQVLSTAKDGRAQISVFPQGVEYLWIFSWLKVAIAVVGGLLVLVVICIGSLSWVSLWLPLTPSVLVFISAGASILCIMYLPFKSTANARTTT